MTSRLTGSRRWRGITAKQALLTLLIAVVLSALAGTAELVLDARQLRTETQQQTLRLLNLVNGSAAEAAFQLNTELAETLADGLFSGGNFARVVIMDDFGRVMANREKAAPADTAVPSHWLLKQLFGDILYYQTDLYYDLGDNLLPQYVGEIELTLALDSIGQSFIDRGQLIFLLGLLKALGIVGLVVVGFHFLITRSLLRLHRALLQIDPVSPGAWPKPDMRRHKHDELGDLVTGLDDLMAAFQAGLDQRDQLKAISAIDGLTGIANRRQFDDILGKQWSLAQRRSAPIGLIFMDIDNFKPFNDNYGHMEGDECLRQVATSLDAAVPRKSDLVARYGGEEFVALLPDTDMSGAIKVAQKIQETVLALDINHEFSDASPRVSLSMGVVSTIPQVGEACSTFLELADHRLYQAKSIGRNRIVWSDDPE